MTQRELLERWWGSLDPLGRRDVLEVEAGDFLSEALALDLQLYGVHVPDVAVAFDVDGLLRRVVVHVQPRELTDFLTAVR
ncbi:hypothetical protein AB2L27_13200 [Kineococcus sp. LSe6-4]|uniref:Uncharacterized protein n=1 Tax=Kineococcus halophytocola TaxID=3234027 RepID=A0ABV4H5P4_9ACTN